MALQTYELQLKFSAEDEQRHEAMRQLFLQYGSDILATAELLREKAAPQIVMKMTDSFYTTEEIKLLPPSDDFHRPDGDAHS